MKRTIIVTLALIFALAPMAQAEYVTVTDGGSDNEKVIFVTDDNGDTSISRMQKTGDHQYVVFGQDGSLSVVNDFSSNDGD